MTAPSNLKGILFLLIGAASFVANDTMMKLALDGLPPFQVLALRGMSAALWSLPIIFFMGDLRKLPQALNRFVVGRGVLETFAIMFFIVALKNVPIGEITAIFQITPFLLTIGAALFMGERLGFMRLVLIAIGFGGALMVAQPGGASAASSYALLGFLVAGFAAARDLVGRRAPASIPVFVATFTTIILVMLTGLAANLIYETWLPPQPRHYALMAGAGLLVMLGHVFTFLAFRNANAQTVAPFYYSFMIWAVLSQIVVFGEWPNVLAVAGMVVILASGLAVIALEQHQSRRAAPSRA